MVVKSASCFWADNPTEEISKTRSSGKHLRKKMGVWIMAFVFLKKLFKK